MRLSEYLALMQHVLANRRNRSSPTYRQVVRHVPTRAGLGRPSAEIHRSEPRAVRHQRAHRDMPIAVRATSRIQGTCDPRRQRLVRIVRLLE